MVIGENMKNMEKIKKNKIYRSSTIWGQAEHTAELFSKTPEVLGAKRIVLVEEKFTLSTEKLLLETIGGIMSTRVMSFGKICDTLKANEKYLSKTSEVMLLSKILNDISKELQIYDFASKKASFATAIYEILSLLNSSHVDFEKLESQELPAGLSRKIADICKIAKTYQSEKSGMFLDANDKMESLFQNFESVDVLKDAEIYIVGFTAFTNQMLDVISKMACRGGVSVYLLEDSSYDKTIENIFFNANIPFEVEKIAENFSPLQTMVAKLLNGETAEKIGDKNGDKNGDVNCTRIATASQNQTATESQKEIATESQNQIATESENRIATASQNRIATESQNKNINEFANKIKAGNQNLTKQASPLHLAVFSAEKFEIENITLKIKHLIKRTKRPQDISVLLANFAGDADAVVRSFEKYEIPYFISKTETLDTFPFSEFILSVIELKSTNYSLESVKRVLSSPFSPLSTSDSCVFENFLIARNVDRGRFFSADIFDSEEVQEICEMQKQFLLCTDIFKNAVLSATEFKDCIENYIKENVDKFACMQVALAGAELAQRSEFSALALKKTLEVLGEMECVLGGEIFTLADLGNIFEGGLVSKEISLIPSSVYAIEIADAESGGICSRENVFILSASKSFFPSVQKDVALLSDKDLAILKNAKIDISPTAEFINEKKEILARQSVLLAKNSLYISYSQISAGSHESGAEIFQKLMAGGECRKLQNEYHFPLEKLGYTFEEAVSSREKAVEVAWEMLVLCVFSERDAIELFARECSKDHMIAREIASCVAGGFQLLGKSSLLEEIKAKNQIEFVDLPLLKGEISPSHLEQYFECPYKSFLARSVRLSDREVGILKEFDTGNFMHGLLEEFTIRAKNMTESEISKEVSKISAEIRNLPQFKKFNNQEKFQYIFARLEREGKKICNHIYKSTEISNFKPTHFELTFGGKSKVVTEGGLALRGKIDRVDVCGDSFTVVDYKTGLVKLTDKTFYHGLKIQSELYLYACEQLLSKRGVGCVYLPISDNFSDKEVSYAMQGKLIASDIVAENLDKNFRENGESAIYPLKRNKAGKVKEAGGVLSEDNFKIHIKSAVQTAEKAKSELEQGYIFPTPYVDSSHDSCKFCGYKSICKSCGENNIRGSLQLEK